MFTHYYTQGVVLAEIKSRDADIIFVLYTKEFGKISVMGRSIRKNSAKLRAKMSLFSLVEVGFISGKSGNTLVDVETIDNFCLAKKSLAKLSLFYRIAEIVQSLAVDEEQDEKVFYLLMESFKGVDRRDFSSQELRLFYCFFTFQLLKNLGYKPRLDDCVTCGGDILEKCYFDAIGGGVVCSECFTTKLMMACDAREKNLVAVEDVNMLRSLLGRCDDDEVINHIKLFNDILEEYIRVIPHKKTPFYK